MLQKDGRWGDSVLHSLSSTHHEKGSVVVGPEKGSVAGPEKGSFVGPEKGSVAGPEKGSVVVGPAKGSVVGHEKGVLWVQYEGMGSQSQGSSVSQRHL